MLRLASWVKKQYKKRRIHTEKQWPPCRGRKLVKLQLVEREAYVSQRQEKNNLSLKLQLVERDAYVSQRQEKDLSQNDKKEVKHTPIKCSELFESKSGEKEIKSVLLEGHAGIGKTTFCTILTEDWSKEEILQQFKLVLLLPLRDKRVAEAQSLSDLVKRLKNDDKLCDSVIEEFDENGGENVLIVADGWDELSESQRSKGQFLYNLLVECSELPSASILLTSRPSASASLHELQCFDRFVQVIGFNRNNIEEYFNSELTLEQASLLIEQLDRNPMIENICAVPLNCAIVCHLFRELGEALPSTMTELYTKIILLIIARNIAKKYEKLVESCKESERESVKQIYKECEYIKSLSSFRAIPKVLQTYWWCLCEFAFWAIEKDKIVISHNEIEGFFLEGRASLDENLSYFGLLQSFEALLSGGVGQGLSFNFLHLTIQEYLAALHLVRQSPDEQLKVCQSHAMNFRFDMVWRFYFGIGCNVELINGTDLSVESKLTMTPEIVVSQELLSCFKSFAGYLDPSLLCHCSFESKSSDVNVFVERAINRLIWSVHFFYATTAHDCTAIVHVLCNYQACHNLSINFNGCNLGDSGVVPLANALTDKSKQLQVEQLHLGANNLTDCGVKKVFSKDNFATFQSLTRLSLNRNKIGEKGLKSIMASLSVGSPRSLISSLDLSNNPLGVSGLQALEDAVHAGTLGNLEKLYLAGTLTSDADINGAVLTTFLSSLSSHCPEMHSLDLSNNNLGVPGAKAIGAACSQLTKHNIQLTNDKHILLLLAFELSLNKTNLGDEGVIAFTQSLDGPCHLSRLRIMENVLHHDAMGALSKSITSGVLKVVSLSLDDNPLGLQGALVVFTMLAHGQLHEVSMRNCSISATDSTLTGFGELTFEKCLQVSTKYSVHFLDLDGNILTRILNFLMPLCSQLETLSCCRCNINSDDIRSLASQLSKRSCKFNLLRYWYLEGNKIDDKGVETLIDHLLTMFPGVIDIHLGQNHAISKDMMHVFRNALQKHNKVR